jgi:ABC-type amino acid transport substrate-binding protein
MRGILTTILLVIFFTSPLSAQELTGTLLQIQKSGKIKIGYRKLRPPMSFLQMDGTPGGYSIDICQEIVVAIEKKIGRDIKTEYIPVTVEDRFKELSDSKIDILCGATTKTLSRSEHVDFTQLTFITGAAFMSLRGAKIINNFNGKKIGVVKHTTTSIALQELFQETQPGADIVFFDSMASGMLALENKTVDAITADQVVLIGLALETGNPEKFSILPNVFSYEPFALAVRRNDADFRLVADRVISHLYRTKQINQIYHNWFGMYTGKMTSAFEALIEINTIPE